MSLAKLHLCVPAIATALLVLPVLPVVSCGPAEPDCEPGGYECECLPDLQCLDGLMCLQVNRESICVLRGNPGDGDGDGDGGGDGDGDGNGDGDGDGDGDGNGDGDGDGDVLPTSSTLIGCFCSGIERMRTRCVNLPCDQIDLACAETCGRLGPVGGEPHCIEDAAYCPPDNGTSRLRCLCGPDDFPAITSCEAPGCGGAADLCEIHCGAFGFDDYRVECTASSPQCGG